MKCKNILLLLVLSLMSIAAQAAPQTTAFTYQGRLLQNGTPTSGNHDMVFSLWDAASSGAQVGSTITQTGYPVANGVFAIDLDFGSNVFNGSQRYLQVQIDGAALSPRQPVNSSPVAQYALSAPNGMSISGATTTSQFSNDRLYAGLNLLGQGLPMVMFASPAFNPAGSSAQIGYPAGVDVYNITSQYVVPVSGGTAGMATSGDQRVLAALDPAYADLAHKLFTGTHYTKLQIDVLSTTGAVLESFCYGNVLVTGAQPLVQSGLVELTFNAAQSGFRIGPHNSTATTGWNFATNVFVAAPCIQ